MFKYWCPKCKREWETIDTTYIVQGSILFNNPKGYKEKNCPDCNYKTKKKLPETKKSYKLDEFK